MLQSAHPRSCAWQLMDLFEEPRTGSTKRSHLKTISNSPPVKRIEELEANLMKVQGHT